MDDSFKEEFIGEVLEEISEILERAIGHLQNNIFTFGKQELDRFFRSVHSLKGNFHAAGFHDFVTPVHSLEDFLLHLKTGKKSYENHTGKSFLAFLKKLEEGVHNLRDEGSVYSILDELNVILKDLMNGESSDSSGNTKELSQKATNKRLRVLIIDDDSEFTDLLKDCLNEDFSFEIETCQDPVKAIGILAENKFDLVFSDYRMPNINGEQLIFLVRGMKDGLNFLTPIIFMSGFSDVLEANRKAWEQVFFLDKPINLVRLRFLIRCCLAPSVAA